MHRRFASLVVLGLGLGLAWLSLSQTASAQTLLRLAYALPSESHYGAGAAAFAAAVEPAGAFKVQSFPNSALGGEREVIEGLQLGSIDLAIVSTGATLNFVPETGVFDLPFLMRDLAQARQVMDGPIGEAMLDRFARHGLRALAWGEQGFRHLTNNQRPVVTAADARGLKIRTMENPVHIAAFRQLGILPTPMAWPELATALQQGTIDGQENPLSVILSARLDQMQKYLALTGHVYGPAVVLVAPARFDGLSAPDQALLRAAARRAARAMRDYVDAVERDGLERLRAAGMVVTTVDRASFVAAVAPAYAGFEEKYGKALIEAIRATPPPSTTPSPSPP